MKGSAHYKTMVKVCGRERRSAGRQDWGKTYF